MNWPGLVFGASLALALACGTGAAFVQAPRGAIAMLAMAMLGVAGVCLALGNTFLAVTVGLALGVLVPAMLLAASLLAPVPEPDSRGGARGGWVAGGIVFAFGLLAWLLTRAPWPAQGGQRQTSIEWVGSRLLTDHLLVLELGAALLSLAGLGVVALLRGRRVGR